MSATGPILREIIEWDTENWSVALDFWQKHSALGFPERQALEIGSRHGGISLWLALQGASTVCSDLGGPSARARELHRRHGVSHLIQYADLDATALPYRDQFDLVVEKSVLGGIGRDDSWERQVLAMRNIHQALRPGGEFLFAENLVASPLHRFARRQFVPWGRRWRYLSLGEMEQLLSPFACHEMIAVGFWGAFGRSEGQRRFLGRLDRRFADRLVPASCRYIAIGVARK